MLISDVLLAILHVMEVFLIAIAVVVVINYTRYKMVSFRFQRKAQQRIIRREEEDVERFIHELYKWAQTNSNLISAR